MSTPPKKPVQPWIPQKVTRLPPPDVMTHVPGAAVVHVVHHHRGLAAHGREQARKTLRAGWIFSLITGSLLGVGVGLAIGKGTSQGMQVIGSIFFGLGYYLVIFFDLVVVVLAIIAMARGAVGRGICLLLGAPLLMFAMAGVGGLIGYGLSHGIVIEAKKAPVEKAPDESADDPVTVKTDAASSALRVDAIIADAQKMLKVRNEDLFKSARTEAFSKAAGPDILEEHREALRAKLNAMFDAAEIQRSRLLPQFRR